MESVTADAVFKDLAFTDASGLHAGEKIGGGVSAHASRRESGWLWQGEVDWKSGEAFWQPLYFADGGHRFAGQGSLEADSLRVSQAACGWRGWGRLSFPVRGNRRAVA